MPASLTLADFEIAYINLKRRPDRRKFIEDQLQQMGLLTQSIYIEGIDGQTLPPKTRDYYLSVFKTMAKKRDRILGRIGCYLTHLMILESAVNTGVDKLLVLEDDCQFVPGAEKKRFTPPKNADILYFGGLFWRQKEREAEPQTGQWVKIRRKHLKMACTLSYGIIGKDKIKEVYETVKAARPSAIDILYINFIQNQGRCYVINPVLAIQNHGFTSDITDIGNKKSKYGTKKNAYFYTQEQEQKQWKLMQKLKKSGGSSGSRKSLQSGGGYGRWYYRRDLWYR